MGFFVGLRMTAKRECHPEGTPEGSRDSSACYPQNDREILRKLRMTAKRECHPEGTTEGSQ